AGSLRVGPFTEADNDDHGELWTPPMPTDDLRIEVEVPFDALGELQIELTQVHHGYAGFGEPPPKSGECHRHVACDESELWSEQVRSVALVSIAGVRFCSGFLVNNTARDGRPFFLTANHCGVTPANAASVVVLWNHQQASCDTSVPEPQDWNAFQSGAIYRAAHRPSDTVLLELDDPPDPQFDVYYAGWDRSLADPAWSTVIHHPNTDLKRISFDDDPARTTAHLSDARWAGGNHLRIGAWDRGSTEGGSSGAPLFNQDKRVVGQLHGGYAACGEAEPDWFGRFSAAWTGYGRPGLRLSDWLDPLNTGVEVLDGMDAPVRSSQ
ncbi:MAG: trypsin-like peptidase domain-containing protein, partial [Acidobacteriota bacterium]